MYLAKISVVLEFGPKQAQLNNIHLELLDKVFDCMLTVGPDVEVSWAAALSLTR